MCDGGIGVQSLRLTDRLIEGAVAQLRQVLPHVLGDEPEEVDQVVHLAGETGTELRVLGRHADRAGVEVTHTHHDASGHDERRGGEAVFLGTEEGGHDDVASGAKRTVALHGDAVAQTVEHERLLGVGQADLPGSARMLERGERRGAGTAVVAGDEHDVGMCLGDAGRDRAHADRADQLDVDTGLGVGVLQIVDQLGEVLDRVDVVVRRR